MDRGDFAAAVDRHYPGLVQRLTLVLHDAEEAKDLWCAPGELKPQQRAALLLNVVDGRSRQTNCRNSSYRCRTSRGHRREPCFPDSPIIAG